ncbi:hypothetical protein PHYSODRAFT_473553 [Phytophthora sojae]|uniref:Tc1-like transposase DDE domain-containing protein n=1 Tax=Phytophthora sojae (strain P6497) TaxID=1094619 RepID=G4YEQ3_PHYSP|nr:hypothetical protein PHYSODRAFT_473553 [Phytophthora sojae]EGZ26897.1 hypothetical protein PHYSODRAFT_473553 [Phytophthora sojae]|eukprot:XP_009514172.1 hypothetical protein PHYSODRAFT_473553 [Phytophthora sojae]
MKLLQYVAAEKKIIYLDETNFNIWISRNYGWSKAGQRAVDTNTSEAANETVRAMLRDQATRGPLGNIVVVLDNAPCHTNVEDVFEEPEFAEAECLRLGPYSPMLNGIENVFSVYKAAVKRYMAANRSRILSVPEGTTITAHRSSFLLHAANVIFQEVVTPALCSKCIHHTFAFIADAILMKDMQVGK